MRKLVLLLSAFAIAACGSSGSSPPGDDTSGDDTPAPDAPPAIGDWTNLIGRGWMVPAGSADTYRCTRIMVTQDMWVTGFRAVAPTGTHHTVVTISTNGSQLGDYDCSVGSLDFQMLYASGVGTDDLMFPTGVAMKVKAGQFLNLNLHLFNATDQAISGTTMIQVKTMAAADVVHEADMMFSGTMQINIPSDGQPHPAVGGCKAPREWNVFTLWPHMHQHATHQKLVITQSGGDSETLLDDAYAFAEQKNYPMAVKTIAPNTRIETTCTYVNTSGTTLMFGDSSNEEMCFTGMYKYPAGGTLFQCAFN
jgi:hypothetical protein